MQINFTEGQQMCPYLPLPGQCVSRYDALRSFAKMLFPLTIENVVWYDTSDDVSNFLLDVIQGVPQGHLAPVRIFHQNLAADMLGRHLLGVLDVTYVQVTEIYTRDIEMTCHDKQFYLLPLKTSTHDQVRTTN